MKPWLFRLFFVSLVPCLLFSSLLSPRLFYAAVWPHLCIYVSIYFLVYFGRSLRTPLYHHVSCIRKKTPPYCAFHPPPPKKKDDITELHCVPRAKVEARGSDRFPDEEKKLMDTWVSEGVRGTSKGSCKQHSTDTAVA